MTKPLMSLALTLAAFACLVLPQAAVAAPDDASSTLAYLRAEKAFGKALADGIPAAKRSAKGFLGRLTAECPKVLAKAPASGGFSSLYAEALFGLAGALVEPFEPTARAFARRIGHLRWRSAKLTHLVHALAVGERVDVAIPVPHVCADMSAWVAGDYKAVPGETRAFLRSWEARERPSPPRSEILKRLAPYEDPSMRTLARLAVKRRSQAERRFAVLLESTAAQLGTALGLGNPPRLRTTPPA
jgi:hypothetical protein